MRLKVRLTEIEWDREVDGEIVDEPLPDTVILYISDNMLAQLVDHVLDQVTDKTGFCVLNAEFEYIQEET